MARKFSPSELCKVVHNTKEMKTKLTRKHGIIIGIGLIVFGIGLALIALVASWANQPVVQDIKTQGSPALTKLPQSQAVHTKFYSATVPGDYQVQVSVNQNDTNLVQAVAFNSTPPKLQVAVTTNLLPSDGLQGVADYHFRAISHTQYAVFTNPNFPPGSKAFKKTSGASELALFIINNNRYASIVVTGNGSEDQLLNLLASFYGSWEWL